MTEVEFRERLFANLDALETRYRRFMRWSLVALAILTAATLWQLFVALPAKTDQIQASRQSVIRQFCEDEKTLVGIAPPGYPPLRGVASDSALNPRRDCNDFARRFVKP